MPDRHQSFDALILRSKESPSGDRIVSMLGAEQGIVDVFVFGGAKSSLRATASPFVHARVFVYEDPVKKFRKLSDLTILESFSGLRETYTRLWCASVVAELIIRTSGCGGDYPYVMELSLEALRLLDSAGDSVSRSTLLAYLWKILGVMGVQPDLDRCSYCGKEIPEGFHDLRFSAAHEGFICGSCGEDANRLTSGELALLEAFTYSSLAECAGIDVGESALSSLKEIIYFLTQKAAEGTLLTLMSE